MAQSNTTDRLYYFARRKDTGMAGVWFTHCASLEMQRQIAYTMERLGKQRHSAIRFSVDPMQTHFPVGFLADNFVAVVKEQCKLHDVSIAADLTMAVLRENGVHNIERLP